VLDRRVYAPCIVDVELNDVQGRVRLRCELSKRCGAIRVAALWLSQTGVDDVTPARQLSRCTVSKATAAPRDQNDLTVA
jgi:hypothetical protein